MEIGITFRILQRQVPQVLAIKILEFYDFLGTLTTASSVYTSKLALPLFKLLVAQAQKDGVGTYLGSPDRPWFWIVTPFSEMLFESWGGMSPDSALTPWDYQHNLMAIKLNNVAALKYGASCTGNQEWRQYIRNICRYATPATLAVCFEIWPEMQSQLQSSPWHTFHHYLLLAYDSHNLAIFEALLQLRPLHTMPLTELHRPDNIWSLACSRDDVPMVRRLVQDLKISRTMLPSITDMTQVFKGDWGSEMRVGKYLITQLELTKLDFKLQYADIIVLIQDLELPALKLIFEDLQFRPTDFTSLCHPNIISYARSRGCDEIAAYLEQLPKSRCSIL